MQTDEVKKIVQNQVEEQVKAKLAEEMAEQVLEDVDEISTFFHILQVLLMRVSMNKEAELGGFQLLLVVQTMFHLFQMKLMLKKQ